MPTDVKTLVSDDWPPPFTFLSKLELNSQNQYSFSCGDFKGKDVNSLVGMEDLTSLTELNISKNSISSLKELSGAPGIRRQAFDAACARARITLWRLV